MGLSSTFGVNGAVDRRGFLSTILAEDLVAAGGTNYPF